VRAVRKLLKNCGPQQGIGNSWVNGDKRVEVTAAFVTSLQLLRE